MKPPPVQSPNQTPDTKPQPAQPATDQDPVLTYQLKAAKICVNHVAYLMGTSQKDCTKNACTYMHVLPSAMGWKDDDYKTFKVNSSHLMAEIPPEHKIKKEDLPMLYGGMLPPTVANPAVALPAAATASEDTQKQETVPETKTADSLAVDSSKIALSALSAPLIGRNYMMRQAL